MSTLTYTIACSQINWSLGFYTFNKTPTNWYAEKQGSAETATYGSEFVAARTTTEQVIDNCLSLRYLGVPVKESFMLGDKESVVNSAPTFRLANFTSDTSCYHGIESESHLQPRFCTLCTSRSINPAADMLSRHWGYQQTWTQLQAVLFWQGDTAALLKEDKSTSPDTVTLGLSGSDKISKHG